MSIFTIEGFAKREVECDIANIDITFRSTGKNAHEVSGKVMNQCDSFLEMMIKAGMKTESFSLEDDSVDESSYDDSYKVCAERSITLRIPFDMKEINFIQSTLQSGKFDYELSVDGDLSNKLEIRSELSKEALKNSRQEAEQIAEVLGLKVKGVESISQNGWEEDEADFIREKEVCFERATPRPSDNIGSKKIIEKVSLKIKWILE